MVDVGRELGVVVWEKLVVVLQKDLVIKCGLPDWCEGTERGELGAFSLDQCA